MRLSLALLPIFSFFSLAASTRSTTSTTTSTMSRVPDSPILFYAELYNASDVCDRTSGSVYGFIYSRGPCQNHLVPGNGSARVTWNARPNNHLTLTGWTEAYCKGKAVPFGRAVGRCVKLNGTAIASWSD
ncbi:hypothetical protein F5B19DRAFT_369907 [Rostrohypoxylon terebratum]|nr:hypothetical protein F5B19DRAFT_369907 [Rostrohypoxylon terebratum]